MDERKLGASPCPKALLIPVEGPLEEVGLDGTLAQLQAIVGGMIQALPLSDFIAGADEATAYVNDDGKFLEACQPNLQGSCCVSTWAAPIWSPDGRYIAFGVGPLYPDQFASGIFIMRADGTRLRMVTAAVEEVAWQRKP